MPKVTDAHKAARRDQILAGARACFDRHGFQATTVRDLEAATGLSSGAIFSYFGSKLDLFLALATEDAHRTAELWLQGGLRAVLDGRAQAGSYAASYLEVGRELLVDETFRQRWEERGETLTAALRGWLLDGQAAGRVRSDLNLEDLLMICVVTLDGCALQLRLGTPADALRVTVSAFEATIRG